MGQALTRSTHSNNAPCTRIGCGVDPRPIEQAISRFVTTSTESKITQGTRPPCQTNSPQILACSWIFYTNRLLSLTYPRALLNDTTAPVVNDFASTINGTNTKITWKTDEFARCTLHYGTQSGNYTGTIEDLLYAQQHTAILPNSTVGVTYYVQATCTDQSDNSIVSTEFSFTTVRRIFLPLVRR